MCCSRHASGPPLTVGDKNKIYIAFGFRNRAKFSYIKQVQIRVNTSIREFHGVITSRISLKLWCSPEE